MVDLPPQFRDRSITINRAGIGITWIPRDQLVPPSTRYTETKAGPLPAAHPPPSPKQKSKKFWLGIMQHLRSLLNTQKSRPPEVLLAGARSPPPLRRKSSFWDLWGKSHGAKRRSSSASSLTGKEFSRLRKFACARCKERQANGERPNCFNYFCRGCGERPVSVLRAGNLVCESCAKDIEDGVLKIRGGWKSEERVCELAGPSVLRKVEILKRAEEGIEASSTTGSLSSTKAVIGHEEQDVEKVEERECRKLKIMKVCGDKESGSVVVDGDGVTIRTCSEDSLVLVSEEDREAVEFNAAQIGSPTGLAKSTWPSPHLRARERVRKKAEEIGAEERPKLFRRRGRDSSPLLEDVISSPIASLRITGGIAVPPNSPEGLVMQLNATSDPIAVLGQKDVLYSELSDLGISPSLHHSTLSSPWMRLLERPSSSSSLSDQAAFSGNPRESVDSTFTIPQSLADSEFCNELVKTRSNVPEGAQQARELPTPTPSPTSLASPRFPEMPSSSRLKSCSWSIASDASSDAVLPLDLLYEECRTRLTRNHASTSISTLNSFPKPSPSPSPPPSPLLPNSSPASEHITGYPSSDQSQGSPNPLKLDSHYFDKAECLYPHSEPERKRSPCLTPYPSLNSSASTIESGFRPTLPMGTDLNATIHPPGCTPPPQASSPGLEEWSNQSVSLFGTTPEIKFYKAGEYEAGNMTKVKVGRVERRVGGKKAVKP